MSEWRVCPDFDEFECTCVGDVQRIDGETFVLFLVSCNKKPKRRYRSLTQYWPGYVYRQVFRAWGPKNPDTTRYTCIDHKDNNPLNDNVKNLRWSNRGLNALNTDIGQSRGWSLDKKRTKPYKAHIRWMGRVTTLGRYKTPEQATAAYLDCKAFIQWAYREQICEDILLVFEWRRRKGPETHKNRSLGQIKRQLTKLKKKGLIK